MIFLPNCSKSARPKKFFLPHESPKPAILKTMLGTRPFGTSISMDHSRVVKNPCQICRSGPTLL